MEKSVKFDNVCYSKKVKMSNEIKRKVRKYLEDNSISQEVFSEKIKISKNNLSMVLNNEKRVFQIDTIVEICEVLKITFEELIEDKETRRQRSLMVKEAKINNYKVEKDHIDKKIYEILKDVDVETKEVIYILLKKFASKK